jgi:hypothetical protein
MYSSPIFTFRKAPALVAFYSTLRLENVQNIHRIHIDFTHNFAPRPDALFDYKFIDSQHTFQSPLMKYTWKDSPTLWSVCCDVMQQMKELKYLSIIVKKEAFICPSRQLLVPKVKPTGFWCYSGSIKQYLQSTLEPLSSAGVDLEIIEEGEATNSASSTVC